MQNVDNDVYISLLRRLQSMDAVADIKIRIAREASLNEERAQYHASGHGLFFCAHDKHLFTPCSSCKRTQADANDNRDKFINKNKMS